MPEEQFESFFVPKERVAVIIGKNGVTRRKIESLTGTKISVESGTGEVSVESEKTGLNFYNALNIIRAIARGFAPEKAFTLADDSFLLEIIPLEDILGKSKSSQIAKKGRIIGRNGAARNILEEKTGCFISVFGKTVAIIGRPDGIERARKAVEMLLEGANHSTVYRFLDSRALEEHRFEL
ncbi:MAG: RNA-processing protein [Candidatus Diapherotrites archaeon]|nr:RNA-processing protein [Candidatus Diapherotrites archaeon]